MKKVIIFTIALISIYIYISQYRRFYTIDTITFTVWKRLGGKGYIMPYKYWGLKLPSKNYIEVPNLGTLSAFLINDSTFIFYCESQSYNDIKINLSDYSYTYYDYPTTLEGIHERDRNYSEDCKKYSKIVFSIREPFVFFYPKTSSEF